MFVDSTGIGKSWLARALGHKACRDGFSLLYNRAGRLFGDLSQARGEGRLPRLLTTLERVRLLIIDDWGPEPLNAEQRRDLLEIVDDRYDRGSLLITSQVPVSRWHEVIGDPPGRRDIGPHRAPRSSHRAQGTLLAPTPCRRRKPRCMTAGAPIAHGGPQRLPARAAPSLVKALRDARGPLVSPWTIRSRLDRPHHAHATYIYVGGAPRCDHHAGLLPPVISVITITGIGDHLQPVWLITFTGMRIPRPRGRAWRCRGAQTHSRWRCPRTTP